MTPGKINNVTVEDLPNENINTISFEGGRGVGKTTVVGKIFTLLDTNPNCSIVTNRTTRSDIDIIDTNKDESPIHQSALLVHQEWIKSFNIVDGLPIPIDPLRSFQLSFSKFQLGVAQLVRESSAYKEAIGSHDLTILDRDLDTVIAYALAEMMLSNPDKLSDSKELYDLASKLWGILIESLSVVGREIPDLTFYFQTDNLVHALDRGHKSKVTTSEDYDLDPFQKRTQDVINMAYDCIFNVRSKMFPDKKFYRINVDGKDAKEVSQIVQLLINRNETDLYDAITVLKIPVNKSYRTIDDLVAAIYENSSGARFPSSLEVSLYGSSNCVYNNAALVEYGNHFGLGTFIFTEVAYSKNIDSSPVHWCALQVSSDGNRCRVIDVTPFNSPYIGGWSSYKKSDGGITFILDDPNYTKLKIDNPEDVYPYMELANLIDRRFDKKELALRLIKDADNESKKIFAVVRYSRLFVRNNSINELGNLFSAYLEKYPSNLVLLREVAKNILSNNDLTIGDIEGKFGKAWENVLKVASTMPEDESRKHLEYYGDINKVLNLFN